MELEICTVNDDEKRRRCRKQREWRAIQYLSSSCDQDIVYSVVIIGRVIARAVGPSIAIPDITLFQLTSLGITAICSGAPHSSKI